jgi:Fe-S-cluster containining protein
MLIAPAIQPILENAELRETVSQLMSSIYRELDATIGQVQSTCRSCKNCCDFAKSGLNLFVSNLELAYFVMNVPPASKIPSGRCPYLDENQGCIVREFRPIGCRTYFCTPPKNYDEQTLYENAIGQVKRFIESHRLAYGYIEWLKGLSEFTPR